MSILLVQRGSPIHGEDARRLERWHVASRRPDEVVLVAMSRRPVAVELPGLVVRPVLGGTFLEVASQAIAASRCSWVIVSLNEASLEGDAFAAFAAHLEVADVAGVALIRSTGTSVSELVLSGIEAGPPPSECLAFRRDAMPGLEERWGTLAPWAAFLRLAAREPVHVHSSPVLAPARLPPQRRTLRVLASTILHAEITPELAVRANEALLDVAMHEVRTSLGGFLHDDAHDLLRRYRSWAIRRRGRRALGPPALAERFSGIYDAIAPVKRYVLGTFREVGKPGAKPWWSRTIRMPP